MMDYPLQVVDIKSKDYPPLLKEISGNVKTLAAPKTLYCRGDISLLKSPCLAVVGTRRITEYGREAAETIVRGLAPYFTIVSGLALGIDAIAHATTVRTAGKTIAVIGGGVTDDRIYPRTNLPLAREILRSGGLIVSEYEKKETIYPWDFPIRNRIVSGISRGTLIIEADIKSGSLVTAKLALMQNRDVFAIPGGIFSPRAHGPNFLIKKGAKLVATAEDILEEYDHLPLRPASTEKLPPIENSILEALNGSPIHLENLIAHTGKEVTEVLTALARLEMKNRIREVGDSLYKKI